MMIEGSGQTAIAAVRIDGDGWCITAKLTPCLFLGSAGRGGHDVSGHTFLLILSFLWMLEEVSPLVPRLIPALQSLYPPSQRWPFPIRARHGASVQVARKTKLPAPGALGYRLGLAATLGLAGLWAWMLLITQVYYHTTSEKLSGLVAGVLAWLLLPKGF